MSDLPVTASGSRTGSGLGRGQQDALDGLLAQDLRHVGLSGDTDISGDICQCRTRLRLARARAHTRHLAPLTGKVGSGANEQLVANLQDLDGVCRQTAPRLLPMPDAADSVIRDALHVHSSTTFAVQSLPAAARQQSNPATHPPTARSRSSRRPV